MGDSRPFRRRGVVAPPATSLLDKIQQAAKPLIDLPYIFGGKNIQRDGGLDCSGFICYVFKAAGIDLGDPDYTNVAKIWTQCNSVQEPRLGDLIFFQHTYPGELLTHIGIVVNLDSYRMLDDHQRLTLDNSPGVGTTDYSSSYWRGKFYAYGRLKVLS